MSGSTLLALYPMGANSFYCYRTTVNAFTTDNTKFSLIGLIIDQLDDGVSAGGAINLDKMGNL